MHQPEGFW